jgi:enoyl-CoA hydratase
VSIESSSSSPPPPEPSERQPPLPGQPERPPLVPEPSERRPSASEPPVGQPSRPESAQPGPPLEDVVLYEVADSGVATITLNEPSTRNALSAQVIGGLISCFERAREEEAVRAVVLASSHETVFSSGANLGGFAGDAALVHKHFGSERFVSLFRLIVGLPKPTVCAAGGHVLAGALGIALACDLVVAKEGATFGTPEINVGAFPFMIMALIYRNVPRKKVNELLLLGERWSAAEALAAGLVNKVVPAPEFDAAVEQWATQLAAKSPLIMRLGKEAMRRQLDMGFDDALDYLRAQLTLAMSSEDIVEGVTAFFEKRPPRWSGR